MVTRKLFEPQLARLRRIPHPEQQLPPALRRTPRESQRGQSLVEFALVLPMLLVLLLGIFYFGRIFSAGITIETAARNGAEAAALERLRDKPPTDPLLVSAYYNNLHAIAAKAVCSEGRSLPDADQDVLTGECTNPIVRACVHDGQDPSCGGLISGFATAIPPECTNLDATANPWSNTSGGDEASHYVEVRVCYEFRGGLSLSLPFAQGIDAGDVWLKRSRSFLLDCPPGPVAAC